MKIKNLGIKVTFNYDSNVSGVVGTVVKQNYKAGTLVDNIDSLILTIKKNVEVEDEKEESDNKNESKDQENSKDEEENDEIITIDDVLPNE